MIAVVDALLGVVAFNSERIKTLGNRCEPISSHQIILRIYKTKTKKKKTIESELKRVKSSAKFAWHFANNNSSFFVFVQIRERHTHIHTLERMIEKRTHTQIDVYCQLSSFQQLHLKSHLYVHCVVRLISRWVEEALLTHASVNWCW